MRGRPPQSLMDYMVIAISPLLIMAMVGSLLFYLVAVFYQGQYEGRLTFIFAMFVMAIVLIARISMEEGIEYASLFAVPLAIVTMLAMVRFVEIRGPLGSYSLPVNAGLIALVWWSAHKLTWDCTFIDDQEDASGEGLLQGMGFDRETVEQQASQHAKGEPASEAGIGEDRDKPRPPHSGGGPPWWQRLVERKRRPHTPGVWVVYYALAALPLFALGRWLLPAASPARSTAFILLVVYVGSSLGLLLTTSFLGLRRYLRQRKMEMPADMAAVWLGVGAVLILAMLLACLILPRPGATTAVSRIPIEFSAPARTRTHDNAFGKDGPEQPQQANRTRQDAKQSGPNAPAGGKAKASGSQRSRASTKSSPSSQSSPKSSASRSRGSMEQPNSASQSSRGASQNGSSAQGRRSDPAARGPNPRAKQPSGSDQSGRSDSGQPSDSGSRRDGSPQKQGSRRFPPSSSPGPQQGRDSPSAQPRRGSSGRSTSASRPQSGREQNTPGQPSSNETRQQSERGKTRGAAEEPRRQDPAQEPAPGKTADKRDAAPTKESTARSSEREPGADSSGPLSRVGQWLPRLSGGLAGLLRLLVWAALMGALLYFGWKYRERIRAALQQLLSDLRELWARLLGGGRRRPKAPEEETPSEARRHRPFSAYGDPFLDGSANRYSTEQLVRYTFEAMEAWARERGYPRDAEQTPLEFAQHVAFEYPALSVEAQQTADLYSRVAYGHERVAASRQATLEQLWAHMRSSARVPAPPPPPVA